MIHLILLVFAFVLFCIAAWRPAAPDAPRLGYLALALCVASVLIGGAR